MPLSFVLAQDIGAEDGQRNLSNRNRHMELIAFLTSMQPTIIMNGVQPRSTSISPFVAGHHAVFNFLCRVKTVNYGLNVEKTSQHVRQRFLGQIDVVCCHFYLFIADGFRDCCQRDRLHDVEDFVDIFRQFVTVTLIVISDLNSVAVYCFSPLLVLDPAL